MRLDSRLAVAGDVTELRAVMDAAIAELQREFLDDAQIASSRAIMGIDTQLIEDGTYFVVESDGRIAGCGGWSRRATLYGSDHTPGWADAELPRTSRTSPASLRQMPYAAMRRSGSNGVATSGILPRFLAISSD